MDMLTLDRPTLDWVALARGQGVPGERVVDAESLTAALGRGLATPGRTWSKQSSSGRLCAACRQRLLDRAPLVPVRRVDPAFHLSFDGPASGQWETPLGRIRITVGEVSIQIDPRDTPTARAMIDALPFEATASTWGDEVYFRTPVSVAREPEARDVVEPGEIAYWPDGDAIAICFGPTPIARAGESRLASRSNVWGDALDDVRALKAVQSGARVRVEKEG